MTLNRTLLKTLSYASMHMTIAITLAYVISKSWAVALTIGLLEPLVQTVAFFFHERAWHKVERTGTPPAADHHDSVIDSVSPVTQLVERALNHHHGDRPPTP